MESQGSFDKALWNDIGKANGPAARAGDLVQITKVTIDDKRILLEINGGTRGGPKWYERIEIGHGQPHLADRLRLRLRLRPAAPAWPWCSRAELPPLTVRRDQEDARAGARLQSCAAPRAVLRDPAAGRSKQAVKEKKAVEGMDRDQVVLALGRPDNKVRETVDGAEAGGLDLRQAARARSSS